MIKKDNEKKKKVKRKNFVDSGLLVLLSGRKEIMNSGSVLRHMDLSNKLCYMMCNMNMIKASGVFRLK